MIKKTSIILLMLLLFCSAIIAKPNMRAVNIPNVNNSVYKSPAAIFQDKAGALWFGTTYAFNAGAAYTNQTTYFSANTQAGKNAGRTLMALNFALGLQSITTQNIKLPKIKVLLLQPLWKLLAYTLLMVFLITVGAVLITNNITQKKLRDKLNAYEQQHELDSETRRVAAVVNKYVITTLGHMTKASATANTENNNPQIAEFTQTGNKLIESIAEFNWCINPDNNTLDRFFPYLRQNLQAFQASTNITFSILLPDGGHPNVLTIEQRRNLLMSIKETVRNAVTHSKAREVIVKAVIIEKGLQIFVSDNGIGFNTDSSFEGTGINNIKQQIADINGRLTLTSEANTGTYYTIFIPLKA